MKVFVDLYNQGLIYRDKRLVNWDPKLKTAISDLEVETREVKGHMWHFKYPLAGGENYTYIERDADGAVVFEEERDYIARSPPPAPKPCWATWRGGRASGRRRATRALIGKLCEIPVGPKAQTGRLIPIIADEYAGPGPSVQRRGQDHAGAHDENDFERRPQRNGIPMYRLTWTRPRSMPQRRRALCRRRTELVPRPNCRGRPGQRRRDRHAQSCARSLSKEARPLLRRASA